MRLRKIFAVIAAVVFIVGCADEKGEIIYNENDVSVYLQSDDSQKLYRNNNENFKIACFDNWDVKVNDGEYLVKFVLETDEGAVWLGVRKELLEDNEKDIAVLKDKYTDELKNGIVKSADVTVGGKKGKWIKVESIEGSGIGLKNKETGEDVAIDQENLVTNDENSFREDLIFILDDDYSYVFLYHADNLSLYNGYEESIDKFLGTFQLC